MFREPTEGSVLYLREDVVYVVEIGTGVLAQFRRYKKSIEST